MAAPGIVPIARSVGAMRNQKWIASKEIERTKRRVEFERNARQSAEDSLVAMRGVNTKLKKRVAAGVCPCCQRSFINLRRHMTTQHADYVKP